MSTFRCDDVWETPDRRQMTDEQEMMDVLANADRKVMARVRVGVSTYDDFVYLAGRLKRKLTDMEK